MKVILWWNLSRDESNLVMKVLIVKELMTGDVSPVAMFYLNMDESPSPPLLYLYRYIHPKKASDVVVLAFLAEKNWRKIWPKNGLKWSKSSQAPRCATSNADQFFSCESYKVTNWRLDKLTKWQTDVFISWQIYVLPDCQFARGNDVMSKTKTKTNTKTYTFTEHFQRDILERDPWPLRHFIRVMRRYDVTHRKDKDKYKDM